MKGALKGKHERKHLYSLKVRDTTQPIRVYSVLNFLSRSVFFFINIGGIKR